MCRRSKGLHLLQPQHDAIRQPSVVCAAGARDCTFCSRSMTPFASNTSANGLSSISRKPNVPS
jgi:hypothetical protein